MPKLDPVAQFGEQLQRVGYVTQNRRLVQQLHLLKVKAQRAKGSIPALLLDGPPGTGKTFAAKSFAKIWSQEGGLQPTFLSLQFTRGIGIERLMADLDIAAIIRAQTTGSSSVSARDFLVPGILYKALVASQQQRVVLLLDELDKAQDHVDAFLLEFLNDCAISDPAEAGKTIKGNPRNLVCFITKNRERQLSEPLLRRCRRVYMTWPTAEVETKLVKQLAMDDLRDLPIHGDVDGLCRAVVDAANKVRRFEAKLLKVPSTPELAQAVADSLLLPPQHRGEVVHSWLLAYQTDIEDVEREDSSLSAASLYEAMKKY